jgi:uncharacterized LabA/DUF88 family protein
LRAAIFIDGGYLLSYIKKHEISLKYENLTDYLLKPFGKTIPLDLLRCYFYYCAPWMSVVPTENEKNRMDEFSIFMEEISSIERWKMRLGKLQKRRDGYKDYFEQKRVDVLLSVDMVRHSASGHIQHVILIAGDSDFIPAIEATKESGATVTLWYGEDNTIHKDLLGMADIAHQLDWKKLPKKKKKDQKKILKNKLVKPSEPTNKINTRPDIRRNNPSNKKVVRKNFQKDQKK